MNWLSHFQSHNVEAEEQLIGELVCNPPLMADVIYRIEWADFYQSSCREIFRAIEQLWLSGRAINPDSIVAQINLNGVKSDRFDVAFIRRYQGSADQCARDSPDHGVVSFLAKVIRDHALLRRLSEFCHESLDDIYGNYETSSEVLARTEVSLYRIDQWYKSLEPKRKRLEELRSMPYGEYLRSPEWKARRDIQVAIDGNACRICGSPDNLNVHHRTYERRGCEAPGDVITLCQPCHQLFHENGRLATAPVVHGLSMDFSF